MRSRFSRRAVAILIAWAIALCSITAILGKRDVQPVTGDTSGAGAYSVSAVGCAGFYDLLRRMGLPAERGLGEARTMTGPDGTLIIAEPDISYAAGIGGSEIKSVRRALIVLPKRDWIGNPRHHGWISGTRLKPESLVNMTLRSLTDDALSVVRKEWPERWTINELGREPYGSGTAQLIASRDIRVIVGDDDGALLGEITSGGRKIWILADPDVMANHGIAKGDNARFMLDAVDALRSWENSDLAAPIVFDETVHGFGAGGGAGGGRNAPFHGARPTITGLMFRFPFVIVTALICCTGVLTVLAGVSRFGAPRPPKPPLGFGKSHLISNSARLLDYGGHHADVIDRYVRMTILNTAKSLHAPENMDCRAAAGWLDRVGQARGAKSSCSSVLHALSAVGTDVKGTKDPHRLFEIAQDIFRWKGEVLIGESSVHKQPR
jgi:hypothetical protein